MTVDEIIEKNEVVKLKREEEVEESNGDEAEEEEAAAGMNSSAGKPCSEPHGDKAAGDQQSEKNNGIARRGEDKGGEENGRLEVVPSGLSFDVARNVAQIRDRSESEDEERQIGESEGEDKLKCGLGMLSPNWMQVFASKQAFLVTFCITWVLQGMYYTYFVSVITTIEKLFQIQSKTTGIIMSATEIGQIGSSLLLTYYGGQGHRPKWIGWGMVLFAVSSFMCALPHFLFGEQLMHANDVLYSGITKNSDVGSTAINSPNLCRSQYMDNYPPPMLMKDHLNFLKENPNYDIRNSFLILHSESQVRHNISSVSFNRNINNERGGDDDDDEDVYGDDDREDSDVGNGDDNEDAGEVLRDEEDRTTGGKNRHKYRDRKFQRRLRPGSASANRDTNTSSPFMLPDFPDLQSAECEEGLLQEQRTHTKITKTVLTIFFVSLLGVGLGQTAVYTLGIPYIDDNVATKESPLYFAITIGVRIIGPAMGFILGSVCTRLYHDLSLDPPITPTDPRWVGAWWLGLVLVGALLILASLAMFSFPKRLKSYKGRLSPQALVRKGENPSLKDFPKAVKRLLQNDILMFRTASSVLHILPIAGLYTFLPKYLESQFRLAAHSANMISGVGGILVMGVGIIISGVFILRVKPNARFVAAWIAFTAILYALGMGVLMLIGCPMDDFAGLNSEGAGQADFQPVCNTTCNCNKDKFSPVCGIDGRTYFSACHAGCRNATFRDGKIVEFSDCLCIDVHNRTLMSSQSPYEIPVSTANIGFCDLNCSNFVPYILLFSMFVFIHSTSEVGSMLLILRCVDPRDKAMALGLIQFAIGLFGNVPCPIVYGAVVDYACLIWDKACGKQGACWLYDRDVFRMFYHGTTGVILLLAFFVDLVVWYKAGSINFVDDQPPAQLEELSPMKLRSETSV